MLISGYLLFATYEMYKYAPHKGIMLVDMYLGGVVIEKDYLEQRLGNRFCRDGYAA